MIWHLMQLSVAVLIIITGLLLFAYMASRLATAAYFKSRNQFQKGKN